LALYQWVLTAVSVAALAGGGRLIDRGYYSQTFIALGVLSLLSAVVFHRQWAAMSHIAMDEPAGLHRLTRGDLITMLRGRFAAVFVLGLCIEPFYYHMVNQLFRNLAHDLHGLDEAAIGAIVALGRLPSLITIYVVARKIDKGNPSLYYGAGIVCSSLAAIALAWAPGTTLMVACFLFYYFCHGTVWASNIAAANATVPPRLREAAVTILCLGQSACAWLAGVLHAEMLRNNYSIPAVFTASGLIAFASGVALLTVTTWQARGVE
jgi:MFS family permease